MKMGLTKTTGCSYNKKASTYKSKRCEKALTSTNQRSILEMLRGNTDGNSENKNAESGDNNPSEALQEQNVEMRSESCEQETESELNDSNWEQASAASVNSSQNISATQSTTLLEVCQTQEKWELQYPFVFYSTSNRGWLCHLFREYSEGDQYWRSVGVKLHKHPTETFKHHMENKKHINAKKKKQEIKNLLSKGSIYK